MDPIEVRLLVEALLNLWQTSVNRECVLTLALENECPDWKSHQFIYVDDLASAENTDLLVSPMRNLAEAVMHGNLDPVFLREILASYEPMANPQNVTPAVN
jgi:hypothetical protein